MVGARPQQTTTNSCYSLCSWVMKLIIKIFQILIIIFLIQGYGNIQQQMPISKCGFFIVMAYIGCFTYGEVGAYSAIKHPLSTEFGFKVTFLGLLDMLRQIGNIVGSIVNLIIPFSKPKRDLFILTTIKSLLIMLLAIGKILPSYHELIYCIVSIGLGCLKIQLSCVYCIVGQFFNPTADKTILNIYSGTVDVGDFFSLMIAKIVMEWVGWDWSIFILIYAGMLFVAGLLVFIFIDECPIQDEEQTFDSVSDFLADKVRNFKSVICHRERGIAVVEEVIFSGLLYNGLLWFPYYFVLTGYKEYALYLTMIQPLLGFGGTATFEFFMDSWMRISHWVSATLLAICTLCHFVMIGVGYEQKSSTTVLLFFILLFVINFLQAGPHNRIFMLQFLYLSRESRVISLYIYITFFLLRCLFNVFTFLLISYLLQSSKTSFLWVLGINSLMVTILEILRNLFFDRGAMFQAIATENERNQSSEGSSF